MTKSTSASARTGVRGTRVAKRQRPSTRLMQVNFREPRYSPCRDTESTYEGASKRRFFLRIAMAPDYEDYIPRIKSPVRC